MKKTKIINIDHYSYTLEDEYLNKYIKPINFYDNIKLVVGDYVYIPEKVLKEKNIFAYGRIREEDIVSLNLDDIIKIETNTKDFYLKKYPNQTLLFRFYWGIMLLNGTSIFNYQKIDIFVHY